MASSGNPNYSGGGSGGGIPFNLFNNNNNNNNNIPQLPNLQNPNLPYPTPQNPNLPYPPLPSASYPPPSSAYAFPHYPPPPLDHQRSGGPYPSPPPLDHQRSGGPYPSPPPIDHQRSGGPYPSPPPIDHQRSGGPYPPPSPLDHQRSGGPCPPSNQGGATLMALLAPPLTPSLPSPVTRAPSSKLPKGRHLAGERAVYDVDVRMEGEVQPQLEVTPITKYSSDPGLILGRQIAVNKTYICYGLKMGAIRVLNINTALRSLLKGLAQRVTDMAFFAEDVHLLASASLDGRIYVWKIAECWVKEPTEAVGNGKENEAEIKAEVIISLQIVGDGESVRPRVCWHSHKQEVLVIGIGKSVLRIDTTKVGKVKINLPEAPLRFSVDNLIDGVQLIGRHEGEVTDLSMCQWMTTRLVSGSTDGTIKIWDDRKSQPLLVLRPHDGQPVNSVTFLTAPNRPDHTILITGGPQNREVKLWVLGSEEGWMLPSDVESWHCMQTLDFKSSLNKLEESFFNQVVALPQAGLLLLANAKKNAIYAVHLEYGASPSATRMVYVAEFSVTMPILSFTGTSDLLPHGEHLIQVYCVQTQAIQKYDLDLSQCLPPPLENNAVLEKSDSFSEGFANFEQPGFRPVEISLTNSAPKPSVYDTVSESLTMTRRSPSSASMDAVISADIATPVSSSAITDRNDISCVTSSPLVLSPKLSGKHSGFKGPNGSDPYPVNDDRGGDKQVIEFSVDRQMDNICIPDVSPVVDDSKRDDISAVLKFKPPTHLVTPAEILMATSSSEANAIEQMSEGVREMKVHDVSVNSDERNVEVDVKVVGETELNNLGVENKEKVFCSQASDLGMEMARECSALSSETYLDHSNLNEDVPTQPSNDEEQVHGTSQDISERNEGLNMPAAVPQQVTPTTKGKKQKCKNTMGSRPLSPSPSALSSVELNSDLAAGSSTVRSTEQIIPDNAAIMDKLLIQMEANRKEDQKQIMAVLNKEIRRVEASMSRMVEKQLKANYDALVARNQEDFAKQEKLAREHQHQLVQLNTNSSSKDLPAVLEKIVKKELAAVGTPVARAVTPIIEKTVSAAIAESFQRGVGDKAVNQLEKSVTSKLEATVSRQILSQFQTSGKQAIQEAMKSSMETTVVPAFDRACKIMFEQVDATFQKGMIEHSTATQQKYESTYSPLATTLRDVINTASSVTQTLTVELAEGQRKFVSLAVNSKAANPLITQLSNGPLGALHDKIEAPLDPTTELSRLIFERKYEEAFNVALQRSDVSIVSWLCSQVDLHKILSVGSIPLSQGVLLSLLQQLACDITKDTSQKIVWMTDVAVAINPTDTLIAMHVRPIFEQVYQILNNHRTLVAPGTESSNVRVLIHVINSLLMGGK